MRKRASYLKKHGRNKGRKLYTALQKEAAYASVASRLKKSMGLTRQDHGTSHTARAIRKAVTVLRPGKYVMVFFKKTGKLRLLPA
jgi:hypothetical protein